MHAPASSLSDTVKPSPALDRYRPDIDGLRAIAVLSVVIFHAFPEALASGFVGVDIFFVISGFLITSIILSDLDKERFSFATFYARRIRRIFPALLVVLTVCIVAGWFLLLPDEYRLFGNHLMAGTGFVANLEFLREANYFDAAADTKILLHLWSLGVEEQYYLAWPVVLWAAWQYGLRLRWLFVILFACSFVYNVATTRSDSVVAFYSPLSRFWELGAGGFLAFAIFRPLPLVTVFENRLGALVRTLMFEPARGGDDDSNYRGLLSVLGLSLVFASTVSITRHHEFPGWWALMPTIGAYLTILAGPSAWLNRTVLSNRVLVWFGLISYPLYLWHWPLLAFARNVIGNTPSLPVRAALVLASIALAWLTYGLLERPIRFGKRRRWTIAILCGSMIVIASAGSIIYFKEGFPDRTERTKYAAYFYHYLRDRTRNLEERKMISQNQCNFYRWNSTVRSIAPRANIDPSCYTRHSSKSVLILGDSTAADLYYGLKEVLPQDVSILLIFSSGCRFGGYVEVALQTNHCHYANYFALNQIRKDPPDIVLIGSNNSFDINDIRGYIREIKGYGVKHVFVLGQRPHWKPYLYKIILKEYWSSTPRYIPGHQDDEIMALGDQFEAQLKPDEPFEFVNEREPFCNPDGCLTYLGDDRKDGLFTFDTTHLRPFASVWLARKQLAPLILKRLEGE